ncbi:MAG TPA: hypothetical protein VET48_13165 [Steroidobacteraceae bacterium]|nr:hypothetical protein [Steroidobacteraceae bacterium]
MFRRIRILILLLLLLFIGLGTLLDRFYTTRWNAPLVVALYPINGDGSAVAEQYSNSLQDKDFAPLEKFFRNEAKEYELKLDQPFQFALATPMKETPPLPPQNANAVVIAMWSLHFRWWASMTPPKPPGPTPRIKMFMLFYDPTQHPVLDHSTGLSKGRLGIAHLFADKKAAGSNQTVIAHELMHTLGATDKYDLATSLPRYPDGFAEPSAMPRFPQRFAELMGGRIPVSATEANIPETLNDVVIGPLTAQEIGWILK